MHAIENFQLTPFLNTLISLLAAFILGSIIGLERQFRQRTAGLRTNVLVAVGAAAFVDLSMRLMPGDTRVIAYVVSGVGFLGAGAIMKDGASVRGLNTAATLWGSAAVGAAAGAGMMAEAVLVAALVLAANTLLRPVVNRIDRSPINEATAEATYALSVICARITQRDVLDKVEAWLEQSNYPLRALDIHPFGEAEVEIEALLLPQAVKAGELDTLTEHLEALPGVNQVFWSSRSDD
ncbi:methyltransferase [Pandoraea terrae]|uniref:Protein MgtC n=1 Tax=Pandoraea terrae TaxID=1537710 RepID=A0A5E4YF07_9BURK|nr:MgtC/SapB family protein [Pandoraea terrae]VVE47294.1 methyltransferase [Pandoraea terrae]